MQTGANMQNQPVTTITFPAVPAKSSSATDGSEAGSFDSILASQYPQADLPGKAAQYNDQHVASPASGKTDTRDIQSANDLTEVLAADLPRNPDKNIPGKNLNTISSQGGENQLDQSSPQSVSDPSTSDQPGDQLYSLPGEMLASLLPGSAGSNGKAATKPAASSFSGTNELPALPSSVTGAGKKTSQAASTSPDAALTGSSVDQVASGKAKTVEKNRFEAIALHGDTRTKAQTTNDSPRLDTTLTPLAGHPLTGHPLAVNLATGGIAGMDTPVHAAINAPLAHEKWGAEFNQKIVWLSSQQGQSAELHLNPPELGHLNITLNVKDDQATAQFVSPHAAVREAVEQALPKLREMMADNGITLGNTTVSDQTPGGQSGNLSGSAQGSPGDNRQSADGKWTVKPEQAVSDGARTNAWPARRHQGMLDTFA